MFEIRGICKVSRRHGTTYTVSVPTTFAGRVMPWCHGSNIGSQIWTLNLRPERGISSLNTESPVLIRAVQSEGGARPQYIYVCVCLGSWILDPLSLRWTCQTAERQVQTWEKQVQTWVGRVQIPNKNQWKTSEVCSMLPAYVLYWHP